VFSQHPAWVYCDGKAIERVFRYLLSVPLPIKAETDTTWATQRRMMCALLRLAKPAFFRYNENFTFGTCFYVVYYRNTGNTYGVLLHKFHVDDVTAGWLGCLAMVARVASGIIVGR